MDYSSDLTFIHHRFNSCYVFCKNGLLSSDASKVSTAIQSILTYLYLLATISLAYYAYNSDSRARQLDDENRELVCSSLKQSIATQKLADTSIRQSESVKAMTESLKNLSARADARATKESIPILVMESEYHDGELKYALVNLNSRFIYISGVIVEKNEEIETFFSNDDLNTTTKVILPGEKVYFNPFKSNDSQTMDRIYNVRIDYSYSYSQNIKEWSLFEMGTKEKSKSNIRLMDMSKFSEIEPVTTTKAKSDGTTTRQSRGGVYE